MSRAEALERLLTQLEWSGSSPSGPEAYASRLPSCPVCGGVRPSRVAQRRFTVVGHQETCELARVLRPAPPAPNPHSEHQVAAHWSFEWDQVAAHYGWINTAHSGVTNVSFFDPLTGLHFGVAHPLTRVLLAGAGRLREPQ